MEHELLENIHSPAEVKKLDESELPRLAEEIRDTIVSTVSENGGHLASNLGAVELTIALHRVFHSPNDKIIWDVGHQIYAHKLLTGRYGKFSTLRQKGGISGFSRPNESEHDIVYSGHSSVSVSTALGIAAANLAQGKKDYAVAVLGDGALTGGLIYEALNNAGRMKGARLIIILNDNGMSISKNVGHLAKSLAVMRARSGYFNLKARTEKIISKIPLIGNPLAKKIFKIKTDVKNMLYKSNFFEDFGVRYMGPIDGHNIEQLCNALEGAKAVKSPVILHINTVKGKGYQPSQTDPSSFHGVGPFDKETGVVPSSADNFSEKFGEFLYMQAAKDKRICAITAAMSLGTGLRRFSEEYPDRFFDVGIAEEHAIPYALGLAKGGMVPVFVVYSTFLQRCFDQLMHDCALQNEKMIIAVDRAGIVGNDGETHNGIYDVSFFNGIPQITVFSPSYYSELNKTFVNALYHSEGPAVIRYPRGSEGVCPEAFDATDNDFDEYGNKEAETTVVTYGRLFGEAYKAFEALQKDGVEMSVVKLNKIIPLNDDLIQLLCHKKNILFFEEGVKSGGIAEKCGSLLAESGFCGDYRIFAFPDCFVAQGNTKEILEEYGLNSSSMIEKVKKAGAFCE